MGQFKTDDPDFNGNRLTGCWGGNGDPYLTIIEEDRNGNVKGRHSVRVSFSGGNFPSEIKCLVGMLVNMINHYEPYVDEEGRFLSGEYVADLYHKKYREQCPNFIHEANWQTYAYSQANGHYPDVYMLGCAVGIKWALDKIKEHIDSPDGEEDLVSIRMKIMDMLKTE